MIQMRALGDTHLLSPSVGLTFPVSYSFCILNNIKAELKRKV